MDGNYKESGFAKTTIGIVGITVSPANPDRLWAIIEAEDGGVFVLTMPAKRGRRRTTNETCASAPVLHAHLRGFRKTPTRFTS